MCARTHTHTWKHTTLAVSVSTWSVKTQAHAGFDPEKLLSLCFIRCTLSLGAGLCEPLTSLSISPLLSFIRNTHSVFNTLPYIDFVNLSHPFDIWHIFSCWALQLFSPNFINGNLSYPVHKMFTIQLRRVKTALLMKTCHTIIKLQNSECSLSSAIRSPAPFFLFP